MLGWESRRPGGAFGPACEGLVRGLLGLGCRISVVVPGDAAAVVPAVRGPVGAPGTRFRIVRLEERSSAGARGAGPPDPRGEVLRLARRVRPIGLRENFDVIHAHNWMSFPAALELHRSSGKPWVAHVHSTEFARSGEAGDEFIATIEREALRRASRVVCVSRRTAGNVRRRYGVAEAKIRVVHNAIERTSAPTGGAFPHDRPLVLFAGRLTRQKGPGCFLEAAVEVLRKRPEAEFLVAGTGDRLEFLKARALELGIEDRVHFPGFLSPARLSEVYRRASVFVLPSLADPFGRTVLEAALAGVPAVVSRQAGVTEVVSSVVPTDPGDAAGLASRILFLLDSPVYRWRLARRASEEVGHLSWRLSAARCLGVYREVC